MLPPTPRGHREADRTALTEEPGGEHPPVIELVGVDPTVRRGLAVCAAHEVGHELYQLPPSAWPRRRSAPSDLTLLWERETLLLPVLLYADVADLPSEETHGIDALLEDLRGRLLVGCREPWPLRGRRLRVVDVARPTAEEQEALWDGALGDGQRESARLAAQFDLNQSVIADVARQVAHAGAPGGAWPACRAQARPRLDDLAVRVEPAASWDDLVLPAAQLATPARDRRAGPPAHARVYERVGLRARASAAGSASPRCSPARAAPARRWPPRCSPTSCGSTSTGSTSAAVVSKYIGETEKNLRAGLRRGRGRAAPSCSSTRPTRCSASAARSRTATTATPTSRSATCCSGWRRTAGLAILTTNMRAGARHARSCGGMRFVVQFPFPDARAARPRSGAASSRRGTPTDGLDFDAAGAARRRRRQHPQHRAQRRVLRGRAAAPVTMDLVLEMARVEFRKHGLPVNDADFRLEAVAP